MELLRQTTYPLLYGVKTAVGPRPSLAKERFVARYNYPLFKHTIRKLANYDYAAQFSGDETLYFYGNPYWSAEKTLVMIDVDCHKRGTLQGARRFAEYLQERWTGLAFEVSTNGNGVHAYVFLSKHKRTVQDVKAALRNFDKYLKLLALEGEFDIENVEIKGLPPEIEYHKEGGITEITYGSLAKLPPTLTFEQLSATTTFQTARDMAILLAILKALFNNRNPEGTMPTERIKALWDVLYENGDVSRPWNHHRYKVMRDWLSEQGRLDWQDHRYCWGQGGEKGIACKWSLTPETYDSLLETEESKASSMDSILLPTPTGEFLMPVKGLQRDTDWLFEAEERLADFFCTTKAA